MLGECRRVKSALLAFTGGAGGITATLRPFNRGPGRQAAGWRARYVAVLAAASHASGEVFAHIHTCLDSDRGRRDAERSVPLISDKHTPSQLGFAPFSLDSVLESGCCGHIKTVYLHLERRAAPLWRDSGAICVWAHRELSLSAHITRQ